MESTLTQGPILYLLIAWGIVTAIFVSLLSWRSLLASQEDDQLFLDAAEDHNAREQRELVAKISSLSRHDWHRGGRVAAGDRRNLGLPRTKKLLVPRRFV